PVGRLAPECQRRGRRWQEKVSKRCQKVSVPAIVENSTLSNNWPQCVAIFTFAPSVLRRCSKSCSVHPRLRYSSSTRRWAFCWSVSCLSSPLAHFPAHPVQQFLLHGRCTEIPPAPGRLPRG